MKIRVAKKVCAKWQRGLCHYTDCHFGAVIRAAGKVASYETRRGRIMNKSDILPKSWW